MAKQVKITVGRPWYVLAQGACTVTCVYDGRVYTLLELKQAGLGSFAAPVSEVTVTDDHAVVFENFKGAPAVVGGGGEDALLSGANTFTGSNVFENDFSVLPLGQTTVLGAPAYGLHVSASGGLQLFGVHFMLSDIWSDHALKVVNDAVCLTSTGEAAIGFDYANKVVFRTMPNDGGAANDNAGAVYEFQGWQWADDTHTERSSCGVDLRKVAAGMLSDESLLNRAEGDARWVTITAGDTRWVRKSINQVAIGVSATATGTNAVSVGTSSQSTSRYAVAIGYNCKSTATATAAAYYGGVTVGQSCTASGPGGVALGHGATAATGKHTTALGQWCKAYGNESLVLGAYGEAHGTDSIAIGFKSIAKANQSVAIGHTAEVNDAGCVAVASWNTANNMRTQLYLIGAGSALAEKYYATPSGAAATNGCLAFVTKKTDGTVVATGMKKLTDLLTDNVYNAETGEGFVATLGLDDEPAPMPFLPEDGFAPIDTEAPVVPMPEEEDLITEQNNEQ